MAKKKQIPNPPIINNKALFTQPVGQICKPDPGSEGPISSPLLPCSSPASKGKAAPLNPASLRGPAE